MQLVAIGAQDVYITGNPQITFFKAVYRRHTNFSKEAIDQTFSGAINEQKETIVNCTLARNGDLIQEIYLQVTCNGRPSTTPSSYVRKSTSNNKLEIHCPNFDEYGDNATIGTDDWVSKLTAPVAATGASNAIQGSLVYFNDDIYFRKSSTVPNNIWTRIFIKNKVYEVVEVTHTQTDSNGLKYSLISFKDPSNNELVLFDVSATGSAISITNNLSDNSAIEASINTLHMFKESTLFRSADMTNIVKEVEIEIGGVTIDKHYNHWLDIYNELFEKNHDYRKEMCNGDGSYALGKTSGITNFIPLRFWFNRNPGLALPLIALQYHEVKIKATLNPVDLVGNYVGSKIDDIVISDARLLVNYIYLDTDERRRFTQVSHEYLIEQVQYTGVENSTKVTLSFNHPVKALFWTSTVEPEGSIKLQLNGHDRFAERIPDYFHLVQPYECGLGHRESLNTTTRNWGPVVKVRDTNNVSMYSFSLNPSDHQPSGSCNFSRLDNCTLHLGTADYSTKGIYIYALSYNIFRVIGGLGGLAYSN